MFLNPALSLLKDHVEYTEASIKELNADLGIIKSQYDERAARLVKAEERRAAYIEAIRRLEP